MKIITVEWCVTCPYKTEKNMRVDYVNWCKCGRMIENIYTIPEWCPLEDYEEDN